MILGFVQCSCVMHHNARPFAFSLMAHCHLEGYCLRENGILAKFFSANRKQTKAFFLSNITLIS